MKKKTRVIIGIKYDFPFNNIRLVPSGGSVENVK